MQNALQPYGCRAFCNKGGEKTYSKRSRLASEAISFS